MNHPPRDTKDFLPGEVDLPKYLVVVLAQIGYIINYLHGLHFAA